MEFIVDIEIHNLLLAFTTLVVPIGIFWYYRVPLLSSTIKAAIRMTIQLLLVGVYLEYIFEQNNTIYNIAWVFIMIVISSITIIKTSKLSLKHFFIPIFIAVLISIVVADTFFMGTMLRLSNPFDARYFIPVTGIILGNNIKNIILGIDSYYRKLSEDVSVYQWYLSNGANKQEALKPFMQHALTLTFKPNIASIAITGLILLPGMMTGQILGGSSPYIAVKYQIILLLTIFSTSIINVVLAILFVNRKVFDKYGNLRPNIFHYI